MYIAPLHLGVFLEIMLFDAFRMTRDDKELKSCPMIDNSRNDYYAEFKRILNLLRFDTHKDI